MSKVVARSGRKRVDAAPKVEGSILTDEVIKQLQAAWPEDKSFEGFIKFLDELDESNLKEADAPSDCQ